VLVDGHGFLLDCDREWGVMDGCRDPPPHRIPGAGLTQPRR
jgi:hypothetical protein